MLHQKSTPSLQYINILHERIFSKIQINKINFYSIEKREHLKHTIKKSKFHNLSKFIIFLIHLDIKFNPIKQKKNKKDITTMNDTRNSLKQEERNLPQSPKSRKQDQ